MLHLLILAALLGKPLAVASSEPQESAPTVRIRNGTVVGSRLNGIDSFLGIPFAKPPIDQLRLRPPEPLDHAFDTLVATGTPTACPQMATGAAAASSSSSIATPPPPQGEDCLTLNIQRPANVTRHKKLPVLFWIFGGGFEVGSTQTYDATLLIQKSVALHQDIIYVAVNYRLNGFGFLAGRELQQAGSTNLGLRDQRLALEWVAENIEAFGGDKDRVTISGESAGSISVYDHLLINSGDNCYHGRPLFRGAIMDSGSLVPATDVSSAKPQGIYDTVVRAGGCANAPSTLDCLRDLPYEVYKAAADSVPPYTSAQGVDLSYRTRPDPNNPFYPVSGDVATRRGDFAKVPAIIGDQEDEGTIFALALSNVTTTDALVKYLITFFPLASKQDVQGLVNTYPPSPEAGSPFRTGSSNEAYPQFKRNAALIGDLQFIMSRRYALSMITSLAPHIPWWSYLSTYGYGTPFVGTAHGSDVEEVFAGLPLEEPGDAVMTYYISFINHLNPNAISTTKPLIEWPRWTENERGLLNFSSTSNSIIKDDFREESYRFLRDHWSVLLI